MRYPISRREFLKDTALAAAALSSSGLDLLASSPKTLERTGPPKKVIVVGAGLAGLSAAYELTQAGHDVTILEAQMRPGGRVLTLREPFSDGLYAEAGATFIPSNHNFTMKYVKMFGLRLLSSFRRGRRVYFLRGKRIVPKPGEAIEWPVHLAPHEQERGLRWRNYVRAALEEIGDPTGLNWPPPALEKYDQMTFAEFLRSRGTSPGAIALIRLGYFDLLGDGIDSYSALMGLRDRALSRGGGTLQTIEGGTDLLPKVFAERLKESIRYGAPVVRIEQDAQSVRVVFLRAGQLHTVAAHRLICTVPFSVLRHLKVSPPFSPAKQRAISELPYTSAALVYLQFWRRFWMDEGLSGRGLTDLPIMSCGHVTANQPGPRGILKSFITGPSARRVTPLKEDERISFVLQHMEKLFAGAQEHLEGGASKCWDEDQWSRGAYCWFRPGQMTSLLPHIARPEGRVHFAGEHTSAWPGWMQGALESGNRTAREVNQAP